MQPERSSFRDPAGQVFTNGKKFNRFIYPPYFQTYDHMMRSGLYGELVAAGLLIPHKEIFRDGVAITIEPDIIPFISYPYEWCFSMLKEAAFNTLEINQIALKYGLMLKDASAYNMQYHDGKMKLIDTLSFIEYRQGMTWGAYRQYLQHFVSPLLLMANRDTSLNRLLALHLDGIPLKLTAKLLPYRMHFSIGTLMHIYAQALDATVKGQAPTMPKAAMMALLNNLEGLVKGIKYEGRSYWTDYADAGSYTPAGLSQKESIVKMILKSLPPGTVCDMGANLGEYSHQAEMFCNEVIAIDSDHDCVDRIKNTVVNVLPLVVDLCNPSPAIGLDNTERKSFLDRLHVDTIMALALIHHLCVGNNIPLRRVAEMLSGHCRNLIIEFVPLEDKQAHKLLAKKNIPPYNEDIFKASFRDYFKIIEAHKIEGGLRTIYSMEKR